MVTQQAVLSAARAYIGVPFVHAGRNQFGLDCVGLLIIVGHDLGLLPPGYAETDYGRAINPERLQAQMERFCAPVLSRHDWQPADIALVNVRGAAQHVGLLTQICPPTGKILHACTALKCVAEQAIDADLWRSIARVYRFRGVQ